MSSQVVAVIVIILAQILPKMGITLSTEELTSTIQVIITLASGLWIWYQRVTKLRRTETPDVNVLGGRK